MKITLAEVDHCPSESPMTPTNTPANPYTLTPSVRTGASRDSGPGAFRRYGTRALCWRKQEPYVGVRPSPDGDRGLSYGVSFP